MGSSTVTAIQLLVIVCVFVGIAGQKSNGSDDDVPRGIVGGRASYIDYHPHQVAILGPGDTHLCGGSIIDERWILTAAHCCHKQRPSAISLRTGSTYYDDGGQKYFASKILYHDKYSPETKVADYDVCVIKTTKSIMYGARVQPIRMVDEYKRYRVGDIATVSGWGVTEDSYTSHSSNDLQVVEVPVISEMECRQAFEEINIIKPIYIITERNICARAPEGGKDACLGDSGGPMVINGVLAGVTSWGYGCGNKLYPGVYGNVAVYRDWIRRNTGV